MTPRRVDDVAVGPRDRREPLRRDVVIAGHTGDHDTARAGLTAVDPTVRASALTALGRLDLLTDETLTAALGDPSPLVRRRAAELAANRPAVDLLPALDDPDAGVVEVAAFACGERGADGATVALVARLAGLATDHDDPLVREAAVAALGALEAPDGLRAILAATNDKPAIRRRAVIALTPFDGPEVEAARQRARQDRDWQVRQAAEDLS